MNAAAAAIIGLAGTLATVSVTFLIAWLKMRSEARASAVARATADREHELARETAQREHELALATVRAKADVELEAARERLAVVDGPATNAEAWSSVFEVTHRTMLALQADVARLEQRLNDQDHEHRLELAERDEQARTREEMLVHTADALRRLRSYVSVVTRLLAEHDIPFPAPPRDVDEVAPERRSLTAPATVTAILDPKLEAIPHPVVEDPKKKTNA